MYLLCELGTNVTYNPYQYYTLRYVRSVYNIYMQPKLVLYITGLTHLLPKVSNVIIISKMDKNEGN